MRINAKWASMVALLGTGLIALGSVSAVSAERASTSADEAQRVVSPMAVYPFTATNSTLTIGFVTDTGTDILCESSTLDGYLDIPFGLIGDKVGEVDSGVFDDCVLLGVFPVEGTMATSDIRYVSPPVLPGDPARVRIEVSDLDFFSSDGSNACVFSAAGSIDAWLHPEIGGTGYDVLELMPVNFTPPGSGFDLTISSASTCGGQVNPGDAMGPDDLSQSLYDVVM